MIDEKLIIEKLESCKEGIQKLNKPYMKKYITPNQFCYIVDKLIEYIETNKEQRNNIMVTKKEIEKIEKIWNDWDSRELTEEEQNYKDNFPYIFAEAMMADFYPDLNKQIINHLSKRLSDDNVFDDYVKVVRCGCCKWWKDKRCTNVNGAYNNTIFNPEWFCRSGQERD